NAYKPKKQDKIDCDCETDENGRRKGFVNSKAFLWIVALVAITLITFPYYSKLFFPKPLVSEAVAEVQQGLISKVQFHIEGMTCTGCEQSVNYALQSTPGVVSVESSYKTGAANVQFDKTKTAPDQLKQTVEKKVGYKVTDIQNIETKE
ncbi:MAG: cation transporter, partial [bacterium]|nr:cation transporter [bacterium]